ncbi:hypothetical protein [uncultured Pseudoalteromonas sp.]|uniref:hypothetical protein n=1 Tax=uncultured Pseudoalteromonas sp. TaxID=114053 RepID=UPI0030D9557E
MKKLNVGSTLLNKIFKSKKSTLVSKILELGKTIEDPERMFSFSGMREDLSELLASSQTNEEKLYANYYLSMIYSKSYDYDYESEIISHSTIALELNATLKKLNQEQVFSLNHRLYEAYSEFNEHQNALEYLQAAIANANHRTQNEVSNLIALKAACFHEVGRYKEALQLNKEILSNPDLEEIKHLILNNLANNSYELGLMEDAEHYLKEMSKTDCGYPEDTFINKFNSIFQLAVLKFELGEIEKSTNLFQQRLKLAIGYGDCDYIEEAEIDIQQLYEKQLSQQN